ncbi:hypothetical protein D3C86_2136130 [compost metagenome]
MQAVVIAAAAPVAAVQRVGAAEAERQGDRHTVFAGDEEHHPPAKGGGEIGKAGRRKCRMVAVLVEG